MSENKTGQIKFAFLLIVLGLLGIFSFNSCIVGDGLGVDSGGNFDGTDPEQCRHPLADSRNPEHTACFVCDPTVKFVGGCYECSAVELADVSDEVCYPCDAPEDKANP